MSRAVAAPTHVPVTPVIDKSSVILAYIHITVSYDLGREQRAYPVIKDLFDQLLSDDEGETAASGYYLQDQ